ncbi:MAG: beta-lactamase family protein [Bacteroidetes bacterium]|nr:beta-lactamase family protein [Bacteroidota bacterium]MBS1756886.1 beta-lactamase family protein [Bacteroidota bacterium]
MKKLLVLAFVITTLSQSCKKNDNNSPGHPKQADIPSIDAKMNTWMTQYLMPGAELGVSVNGKLVYKKGYGKADKESGDTVNGDSRFRIASVSKLFTSAAIMKLVQDGKLSVTQKVFGAGGILGTTYGTQPYKQYVTDITVDELLHHTCGGWGQSSDPALYDKTLNATQVINWTLDNNLLAYPPGTHFDYSNFGYMLLAKIVEKLSGKTYEQYFTDEFLSKVNATHTTIAGTSLADRQLGEVKYYGQGTDIPYVYDYIQFLRADGAMGWCSNVSDLLKFATSVDSSSTRPDILNGNTLQIMTTTYPASNGLGFTFGCGWVVESGEWFWWGSLPGTFAILYRNKNGICISALANSRAVNSVNSLFDFIGIINYISTDNTIQWQNVDQF